MSGLATFRQQHPQYNDMPDAALADALHAKFYADMPKDQYLQSLGLAPAAAPVVPVPTPTTGAPARPASVRQTDPNLTTGLDMAAATGGALVGAKGGAVLGAAGGPFAPATVPIGAIIGAVVGGGLGYGASREVQQIADLQRGAATRETPAEMARRAGGNVVTGGAMEAIGRGAAPIIGRAVSGVAGLSGRVADLGNTATIKAGNILRAAAGDRLPAIRNALANAPEGATPAQAIVDARAPVVQTLLERAGSRTPAGVNAADDIAFRQREEALAGLRALAGGGSVTEVRQAARTGQNALNDRLIPTLENSLARANEGSAAIMGLTREAEQLRGQAAGAVQDVRRFTAAGERFAEGKILPRGSTTPQLAPMSTPVPGQPRAPTRYTHMGELSEAALRKADDSAALSLDFGAAARFREAGLADLAANGIRTPLTPTPVIARIQARLDDPKNAGKDLLQGALTQVMDDIQKWTKNGVVDAAAFNAIRQHSITSAVQKLRGNLSQKAQAREAAGIMGDFTRLVGDAIEEAGGKGYKQYLKSYSEGMRQIGERKMGGEMLRLYETSPQKFIDLVEGNAPKAVEKVFGPGNFDLADQMSPSAYQMVRRLANQTRATLGAADQAKAGTRALETLLTDNLSMVRIPNQLNVVATATNRVLDVIETKLGNKVMNQLTAAANDGKKLTQALDALPAADRVRTLRVLREAGLSPTTRQAAGRATSAIGINALAGEPQEAR